MSRRLLTAALLATLTAFAVAQPPRPALDDVFKRFDANKDGKLSRAEFEKFADFAPRLKGEKKEAVDALFKKLDTKNNGFLTLDEFKKLAELAPRDGMKKGPFAKFKDKGDPKPAAPTADEKPATVEQIAFFEKKIRP